MRLRNRHLTGLCGAVSSRHLAQLRRAIDIEPRGTFAVDAWTFGRRGLYAAAEAGERAYHHHAQAIQRPQKKALANQALRDALEALKRIRELENLFDIHDLGQAAKRFEELALQRLTGDVHATQTRRGSPGNAHVRLMTEAAAEVWAHQTKRPLPRAGIKGDHPLSEFLSAVSLDIFGERARLSANNLRPRKSRNIS
jgi:hypothetical protein